MTWWHPWHMDHTNTIPSLVWNRYVKDNLHHAKDHHAVTAGAHSLQANLRPAGRWWVRRTHMEGFCSELMSFGGENEEAADGWGQVTFTYTRPFTANPVVVMSKWDSHDGRDGRRIGAVTTTAVDLLGWANQPRSDLRLACIVCGVQPDDEEPEDAGLDWQTVRTWGQISLLTYTDINTYIMDNMVYLVPGHSEQSNGVHGLAAGVYPMGCPSSGAALVVDAMRYPPGDVDTQAHGAPYQASYNLPWIGTADNVCVVAGMEYDMYAAHYQYWRWTGAQQLEVRWGGPPYAANWYASILAIGSL